MRPRITTRRGVPYLVLAHLKAMSDRLIRDRMTGTYLLILILEILIIFIIIVTLLLFKLLRGLGIVNILAASPRADNVIHVDLLHVVLIGILHVAIAFDLSANEHPLQLCPPGNRAQTLPTSSSSSESLSAATGTSSAILPLPLPSFSGDSMEESTLSFAVVTPLLLLMVVVWFALRCVGAS